MRESELTLEGVAEQRPRRVGLLKLARRHAVGVAGLVVIVMIGLTAAFGPFLLEYGPNAQDSPSLLRPSAEHPFGTDLLGRDVLSRVVHGARVSLGVGFVAVLIGVSGGSLIGVISAYYGGWLDYLVQRIVEVVMAFPAIILMITIAAVLGPSIRNTALILGVVTMPILTRVVRSIIVSEKERPYIEAARSLGATNSRILFVHVVPATFAIAGILAALALGSMILAEAGLSFIGMGVPVPNPSWGGDMSGNARTYLQQAPWLAIFPGLAVSITIFGANLIADAVRDIVDPFSKMSGGR